MIKERGGKWYVVVKYRDENNKRCERWYFAANTEREAKRKEHNIMADIDRGELIPSKAMTVSNFLDKWLKESIKCSDELALSTYTFYNSNSNRLKAGIGDNRLEKLSPLDIQQYLNKERERGIKPTSVRAQYVTLNVAMKKAVQWRLIAKNPCDGVDKPGKNKPKRQAVAPAVAQRIMGLFAGTVIHTAVIIGLATGLRRGEICGLRWSDVDLPNRTVHVRHSLDRIKKVEAERLQKAGKVFWMGCESKLRKGSREISVLALGPVKTETSDDKLALPELLVPFLESLAHTQKKNRLALGKAYQKNNFVLCYEDGRPVEPDYVYHRFVKTLNQHNDAIDKEIAKAKEENRPPKRSEDEKLPVIRIHDLRHTFATTLLYSGISAKQAAKATRHADANFMQNEYQHIIEEIQRDPAAAIDKVFGCWGENRGEDEKSGSKA